MSNIILQPKCEFKDKRKVDYYKEYMLDSWSDTKSRENNRILALSKQSKLAIDRMERELSYLHTCGVLLNYDLLAQGWDLSRAEWELGNLQESASDMTRIASET